MAARKGVSGCRGNTRRVLSRRCTVPMMADGAFTPPLVLVRLGRSARGTSRRALLALALLGGGVRCSARAAGSDASLVRALAAEPPARAIAPRLSIGGAWAPCTPA